MRFFPNNRKFGWSSSKTQEWDTTVQRSASGKVRTLSNQLLPRWKIKASYPALSDDEARELLGFYSLVKGQFEPFLWLDPEDNAYTNRPLAYTGASGVYQATMAQGDFTEDVEYIADVTVYIDGAKRTDYTLDGGLVRFSGAVDVNSIVTADYKY